MDCGFEFSGAHASGSAITYGRLMGIGLPSALCGRRSAVLAQRADRISRHVEAHLDDPELTARSCARALGMSVRSLHAALAGTSCSFNEMLLRRRLELCRALLSQWDRVDSIADLAFACGFNSLSSFYRAFRRHFGTCPRALRQV